MKKLFTVFAVLVAFGFNANAAEEKHPYTEVDAAGVQKLQEKEKKLVIIDARGREYITGNIIKGAKILPTNEMTEETLAALVSDKSTPILLYCQNPKCPASALSAYKAAGWGYTNLFKYPEGIEDWEAKKLPVEKAVQ